MGNDIMTYRMMIGLFYFRIRCTTQKVRIHSVNYYLFLLLLLLCLVKQFARILPKLLQRYFFAAFQENIAFTLILLQLILLCHDVEKNPGPKSPKSEFSIFHWNARSVRNKIEYLQTLSADSSVICITESHLDENVSFENLDIPGYYNVDFRKDRNCFGGGVLIYVSDNLHAVRRHALNLKMVS